MITWTVDVEESSEKNSMDTGQGIRLRKTSWN